MQLKLLKSKLHQAAVTGVDLHYNGSLTVGVDLMEAVGLLPHEAVVVSNIATGQRAETYVIPGEGDGRRIELNGAMARLGTVGDRLIVMSFALLDLDEAEVHRPRVAVLDDQNRLVECLEYEPAESAERPAAG